MKTHKYEDIIFEIGENAKDNWEIFERNKEIDSDYVWFHLNSFPSSYVIMKFSILELNENYSKSEIDNILYYGGNLCRENSKYKFLKDLKIVYTTLKKLKKGTKEGEVIISGKKNLIKLS
jgi:predicted ribosome quality control (RQC) complex YloA/Tae2 family protein